MNKKMLLSFVSFVIVVSSTVRGETPPTWEQVPAILARIIPAKFPDRQIDVTTYGAKGDGQTDCCKAIRDAVDACSKAGGGRVVVPAGQFLCNGPIHLKSHVNLQLSEGCTLLFGTNPDDYLVGSSANGGGVLVRWEGTRCYNYSPLIYAYQQTNIAVTGRGTIDGQTKKFWSPWKSKQRGDQQTLRNMGKTGVPIEKRVFGRDHFLRPSLFSPYQCDKVLIEGVTVKASPFWTIHPVLCNQVVIRDVTVEPGTTNDDGCDPESCTDVLIEGCTFETNDDNIAIKAGRDNDAWAANGGKACENIVIRNCTFKRGTPGGVSIGSEMSGDVRNVFIEKCKMGSVNRPIYIKSNPDRGGIVENIWAHDMTVDSCTILFHCEMNYKRVTQGPSMPAFRDVHIENIACKKAAKAIDCQGLPGNPIRNVSIRNITVDSASTPLMTGFVEGLRMENVKVNGVIVTPGSNRLVVDYGSMECATNYVLAAQAASPVSAQQVAAKPVSEDLEMNFKNPPESAKPWVFWIWMNGNITREGITADLEAMRRVGIGGVELFNVNTTTPRGPVDFMSPAWHELVQHAVSEAGRLRMRMVMMNCAGWSSSGGPWVKPEEAMQMLAWTDLRVRGPARFSQTLPQAEFEQRLYTTGSHPGYPKGTEPLKPVGSRFYRDIAVLAFPTPRDEPEDRSKRRLSLKETLELNRGKGTPSMPIPKGTVIDLTSRLQADGRLEWDVPEGQWTLLRLGHTPTDQCNMPAPPGGEGLECDKLSPRGLQAVWDGLMKGIINTAGPRTGKAFSGVLIDSWEVGLQHWSPAFAAEFTKRRGYDPTPWLPVLSGREVDSGELSNRFLWDMRRTVSDLIADNYFGELTRLCHARGLTSISETYGGPFDAVQAGGRVDIPMGEFWAGKSENPVPGEMAGTCKLAASSAHGYGKPIVAAEAFTARPSDSRWSNTPYSLKIRGDWAFCQGINRYVFHRYAHQPWLDVSPGMTMGPYGINFERSNTWWEQSRAWLSYIARCQFLLQQGRFVADVAYLPSDLAPPHRQLRKIPFDVPGHDFDILSPELVLQMRMVEGMLTLPSGMRYKALVVGGDGSLQAVLVEKMRELALAGAVISCPRPTLSPSLRDYPAGDARIASIASEMWDGKRIATTNAATLLKEAGILPDFEGPVQFTHRQTPDVDIYFLAHPVRKPLNCTAIFRVSGRHAEIWHPDSGAIEPATVVGSRPDGRTELALHFDPAGSFFVVFRKEVKSEKLKVKSEGQKNFSEIKPVQEITGPWTVDFPPKLGAPASVTLDSLISLNEHATAGVRYFSGTATYSKSFELPTEKVEPGTRQILDLGGVENIAEVFVNGVNLGILWKPPFAVDITNATKPGTNRLEVRVTNQWINRLIGDEQEASDVEWTPGDQGLTLKELPEWFVKGKPRPSTGRICFTTFKLYEKDSPLVKSGLLGPVTLRFTKRVEPKE